MKKTIIQFFEECVGRYGNNTFMWEKNDGVFVPTTYNETKDAVYTLASGLLSLGVGKSDRVALLSEGRNAWIESELAIFYVGAVNVPLSIKLEESNDLFFRLKHSDTKFLIVSNTQLRKVRSILKDLPLIEKVIVLGHHDDVLENEVSYEEVLRLGLESLDQNKSQIEVLSQSVKGDDLANISYTSGTTADPKGIMLSHRNYTANVEQVMSLFDIEEGDSNLIVLPLDHCFAHVAGFYAFMAFGANVATVQVGKTPMETLKNIPLNIKEFKPTIMMTVPALAKNFKKAIETSIKAKGEKTERLFYKALDLAYKYNKEGYNKRGSFIDKVKLKIYDTLLFAKVREGAFGGNLKFFIGGGALLDIELQRFFYALGVPMLQGYGLSEATPVISANSLHKHKLGSSGAVVDNLLLKICDDEGNELPQGEKGEIIVKGENVMLGYWKNEEATNSTVKDGWLYTGDMGYVDTDGFLYVLGRFKSLLISSDGEKYSPEGIEESLVEKCKYIDQVVLYNNQNAYTTALVVPNISNLREAMKSQSNLDWNSQEAKELALSFIQKEVDKYKSKGEFAGEFPERWLPSAIAVLPEPFTEANHMVNSTMKIVRHKVESHYEDFINFLYTPEGKKIINERNIRSLNQ